MKALGYILTGVGCLAAGFGIGYGVATHVEKKKSEERELNLKNELTDSFAAQISEQREYYKHKLHKQDQVEETKAELVEATKELIKDTEMKPEEANKATDGVNIYKGMRASEIVQEKVEKEDYHKMYGPEDVPGSDFAEDVWDGVNINVAPEPEDDPSVLGPHLVDRAEALGDIPNWRQDYEQFQFIYFTEDVEKGPDGEFEHVPVLYAEGDRDSVDFDTPYTDRCIKKEEAEDIIGHEWRDAFGTRDYDMNEVVIRNDKAHAYFWIQREHNMYKVAIQKLGPGDPFDYSKVR